MDTLKVTVLFREDKKRPAVYHVQSLAARASEFAAGNLELRFPNGEEKLIPLEDIFSFRVLVAKKEGEPCEPVTNLESYEAG